MMTKREQKWSARIAAARALRADRGMSLVEILIVLTIMASIATAVTVFGMGALNDANIKEANIEVGTLEGLVQQYMLRQSPPSLPDNLDQLAEGASPVTKKVPNDPWGNAYVYSKESNAEFTISSMGPDGQQGTEDDIPRLEE